MLVKFLSHGKGSARAAVEFLVGERDAAGQERDGVEVVRGNPDWWPPWPTRLSSSAGTRRP